MLDQFDSIVGLKELGVAYKPLKSCLNSKVDRHEHIGLGKIGNAGFGALLQHKSVRNLPMIMETRVDKHRLTI
jgi:deoxyribonuclease IV